MKKKSGKGKSREEKPRVGVFICHCGTNIAGVVDVKKVVKFASKLPDVAYAMDTRYACSEQGQNEIKQAIKEHKLNRVVVAACSPRMHEPTFRETIREAGLNPYLLEMANIREQCSWVHMHKPEEATRKACSLVASAVAKAKLLIPLKPLEFKVTPAVLIIGGGIAGIQAALDVAEKGFKVYLVEKTPSIGGHMAMLDKTFPTLDCSTCILGPKMSAVARHPNIEILTYSEVVEVEGFVGNFKVKVLRKPRYVHEDKCNGCGRCAEVCPIEVPNEFDQNLGPRKAIYIPFPQAVPLIYTIDMDHCIGCLKCVEACHEEGRDAIDFEMQPQTITLEVGSIIVATGYEPFDATAIEQYGYGIYENVITTIEFERMISAAGPTGGKVIRFSDRKPPKRIAFISCVGSRDVNQNPYCSRICCMAMIKHAHQILAQNPDAQVVVFYMDLRTFGKGYEEFLERVQREGLTLLRGKVAEIREDPETKNLRLRFEDTLLNQIFDLEFDMVVLSIGLTPPPDIEKLQKILKISLSPDRFFLEAHPKLRPVETHVAGIYVAGTAQGPKDIPDTVAQASAAASQATTPLVAGKVYAEATVAVVDQDKCGACQTCVRTCPFGAPQMVETEKGLKAEINEALCQGCGACVAACPAGAITQRNFTDGQIQAQLDALIRW